MNTAVVFIRLYWFEKRFQHIVKSATEWRRSRTRSRSVTENQFHGDPDREERGVNGRNIVVLRNDVQGNGYISKAIGPDEDKTGPVAESSPPSASSDEKKESDDSLDCEFKPPLMTTQPAQPATFQRDITFGDEVRSPDPNDPSSLQIPLGLTAEQHIAFLENQRNPKDKGTLRIPGPRDFDRGDLPETLDQSGQPEDQTGKMEEISEINSNDHGVKRNITIDEPNHPRSRTRTSTFPKLNLFRPGSSNQRPSFEGSPSKIRTRQRSGSTSSMKSPQNQDGDKDTPYLSWQPTVGRNSAFIDLTEEQREELGGIEYRALKALALVLVCKIPRLDTRRLPDAKSSLSSILCILPHFWHSVFGCLDCSQ